MPKAKKSKTKAKKSATGDYDNPRFRRLTMTLWQKPHLPSIAKSGKVNYFVSGLEYAPSTGREHWQSYMEFHGQMRLKAIKKMLGVSDFKVLESKGTWVQNYDYCVKDGNEIIQWGEPKEQGKRNDLHDMAKLIREGTSLEELYQDPDNDATLARYGRWAEKLVSYNMKPRKVMTKCYIYWGPGGTGKSHRCHHEAKDTMENGRLPYYKQTHNMWWPNYNGTDPVILEDFRGEIALQEMLKIVDIWPLTVDVKHGQAQFAAPAVYISSNAPPWKWWNPDQKNYQESMEAFGRRITLMENMTEVYTGPTGPQRYIWSYELYEYIENPEWKDAQEKKIEDTVPTQNQTSQETSSGSISPCENL